MKVLVIILSIYSIALTAIHCDDEAVFESEQLASITQNNDDNGHNTMDLCSPFCICACCSISITKPTPPVEKELYITIASKAVVGIQETFFLNNFSNKIDQPPQV